MPQVTKSSWKGKQQIVATGVRTLFFCAFQVLQFLFGSPSHVFPAVLRKTFCLKPRSRNVSSVFVINFNHSRRTNLFLRGFLAVSDELRGPERVFLPFRKSEIETLVHTSENQVMMLAEVVCEICHLSRCRYA